MIWFPIKHGILTTLRQRFSIFILFLYQFAWGFWLYRFIQSIVVPLLHRYPGKSIDPENIHLFLAEAQFRLFNTDLIRPYMLTLTVMILIRILLNPIMNAGIFYSLFHPTLNSGYRFVQGVRSLVIPYFFIYLLEVLCTLIPFLWIGPKGYHYLLNHGLTVDTLKHGVPWLLAIIVYEIIIHLSFMNVYFAVASERPAGTLLLQSIRVIFPITFVFLLMLGIALLAVSITVTISFIWAGLLTVILHQVYYLLRTIFKLWTISAQYHVWIERVEG